jgi:hypothetical protein
MFYKVNKSIGQFRDAAAFTGLIAEELRHGREIEVVPLGETQRDLFEAIGNKSWELTGLADAIRSMSNLHIEGTVSDYVEDGYYTLCDSIVKIAKEIIDLAAATGPDCRDNFLEPILKEQKEEKKPTKGRKYA